MEIKTIWDLKDPQQSIFDGSVKIDQDVKDAITGYLKRWSNLDSPRGQFRNDILSCSITRYDDYGDLAYAQGTMDFIWYLNGWDKTVRNYTFLLRIASHDEDVYRMGKPECFERVFAIEMFPFPMR